MASVTLDIQISGLTALANTLGVVPFLADDAQADESTAGLDDLYDLMKDRADSAGNPTALLHVDTGRLRDSFRTTTPTRRGRGQTEQALRPGVDYAQDEIDRGGEHDYATRSVGAAGPILQATAERLARRIARIVEDG